MQLYSWYVKCQRFKVWFQEMVASSALRKWKSNETPKKVVREKQSVILMDKISRKT